jgi:hypothetical protein
VHGWELTASNDDDGVALAVEELLAQDNSNRDQEIAALPMVEFAQ